MTTAITGSMLYDLIACPNRVSMDLHGDPRQRDEANAFVQLLWEKGSLYEKELIDGLEEPFLDLSPYSGDEKERLTAEAMYRGEPLIYSCRIQADDLLGDPDLLRREADGYAAIDIKSGSGEDGFDDNARPKKHYAVQLGLYTDILERMGLSSARKAYIWDIHKREVEYDFTATQGIRNPRTLWQDYEDCLAEARLIAGDARRAAPAASATCKLCHWYSACRRWLIKSDDLTLIPELGRAKRDIMSGAIRSVRELAETNPNDFINGRKTTFKGIGPATLIKYSERAMLLAAGDDAKPYLREPTVLPNYDLELFFDIEVDTMREICYLHGFIERRNGDIATERFVPFFAEEPTNEYEKQAFTDAFAYVKASQPCAIYYYSKYERTIYRKLQEKYPDVCEQKEIERIFDPAICVDLYNDVVKKSTEWPTYDFSIKTLAKYLGFKWRDTNPSGAASIEWFDRWVRTGDREIRQRILDYNEDDCIATRVLLDGIKDLTTVN